MGNCRATTSEHPFQRAGASTRWGKAISGFPIWRLARSVASDLAGENVVEAMVAQAGGMFRGRRCPLLVRTPLSSPVQAESRCPDRLTLCSDCYRAPILTDRPSRGA